MAPRHRPAPPGFPAARSAGTRPERSGAAPVRRLRTAGEARPGRHGRGVSRAPAIAASAKWQSSCSSAGPWASPDFIERFRREAQSAARMQHPNIVAIYEIGSHEELNFFSMRLVRGESLAQRLQRTGRSRPSARGATACAPSPKRSTMRTAWACCTWTSSPQRADRRTRRTAGRRFRPGAPAGRDADAGQRRGLGHAELHGARAGADKSQSCRRPPTSTAWARSCTNCSPGGRRSSRPTPQEILRSVIGEEPTPPASAPTRVPPDLEAICLKCLAKEPGRTLSRPRARWSTTSAVSWTADRCARAR